MNARAALNPFTRLCRASVPAQIVMGAAAGERLPFMARPSTPRAPKLPPESLFVLHQMIDQLADRNPRAIAALGLVVGAMWKKQIGFQTPKGGRRR